MDGDRRFSDGTLEQRVVVVAAPIFCDSAQIFSGAEGSAPSSGFCGTPAKKQLDGLVATGPVKSRSVCLKLLGLWQSASQLHIDGDGLIAHHSDGLLGGDAEMAALVVRSVNPLSTVAYFSGVGLRIIPPLALYNSLKTLNLSANHIGELLLQMDFLGCR
ncbi:unnamed protein product [Sphagnum compactum]